MSTRAPTRDTDSITAARRCARRIGSPMSSCPLSPLPAQRARCSIPCSIEPRTGAAPAHDSRRPRPERRRASPSTEASSSPANAENRANRAPGQRTRSTFGPPCHADIAASSGSEKVYGVPSMSASIPRNSRFHAPSMIASAAARRGHRRNMDTRLAAITMTQKTI